MVKWVKNSHVFNAFLPFDSFVLQLNWISTGVISKSDANTWVGRPYSKVKYTFSGSCIILTAVCVVSIIINELNAVIISSLYVKRKEKIIKRKKISKEVYIDL